MASDKKIFIVTTNRDKYEEISSVLGGYGIEAEQCEIELEEKEETLEEIVRSKAGQAFAATGKPVIVDDTGIFFNAFDNFPGHRARRVYKELGYEGILEKLEGRKRSALFKSVIAYKDANVTKLFEGTLKGTIATNVRSAARKKFPYDAIFIPDGFDVALSEIPWNERLKLSHRAQAARKFAEWFRRRREPRF